MRSIDTSIIDTMGRSLDLFHQPRETTSDIKPPVLGELVVANLIDHERNGLEHSEPPSPPEQEQEQQHEQDEQEASMTLLPQTESEAPPTTTPEQDIESALPDIVSQAEQTFLQVPSQSESITRRVINHYSSRRKRAPVERRTLLESTNDALRLLSGKYTSTRSCPCIHYVVLLVR